MEQNSELVNTPPTPKGQNQAQNVDSTLSWQTTKNQANPIVPYVGFYVAQCSRCFKWRFLPSKEEFEEKCERNAFLCTDIREWRPEITCCDETDVPDDATWAIEKRNIARPPPGWERQLKIRGSGGSRYADVYYIPPSGKKKKRLRSRVDVERYFVDHPDEAEGVDLSQFSFQIPTPSRKIYQSYVPEPED
ncbi:hypothetical protein POM88_051855 [Heracleum sosnowskyi]|uniref:Methyl-CpG-binding domain-containing protein 2 n=1 Tax=Heracleum sosnowskyi TaxID=360622 RepID=A0AAD8LWR7_9APIA|nr:hypothetical protein POM88_051855 [Heracleum sosnowskyi]